MSWPWNLIRGRVSTADGPQGDGESPANPRDKPPGAEESLATPRDAAQLLRAFINDFLAPIAADGRLDQKEETPLLAAYCAYGTVCGMRRSEHRRRATIANRNKPCDPS
jgi:hypothetical protein